VSRLLWLVALLGAVIAAGQIVVPTVVAGNLSRELQQVTGPGRRDTVHVVAVPFWTLAAGEFQELTWDVTGWHIGALRVRTLSLRWENGGLNVPDLVRHRSLVVTQLGHMTIRMAVDGPALARLLEASGRVRQARVTVRAHDIELAGNVQFNGLSGPVTARGTLEVSPDGHQILCRPLAVDGIGIPFPAAIAVFDVSQLQVPVPLVIRSVSLVPPNVVVVMETP
jgi:hypothetical protein